MLSFDLQVVLAPHKAGSQSEQVAQLPTWNSTRDGTGFQIGKQTRIELDSSLGSKLIGAKTKNTS